MELPHHKMMWRTQRIISFRMPDEMAEAMQPHIVCGWYALKTSGTKELFLQPCGRLHSVETFWAYFQNVVNYILQQHGARPTRMGPQLVRHAFVEFLRSADCSRPEEAEVFERTCALIMGNSVGTWDARYHLTIGEAQIQNAIEGLKDLRAAMVEALRRNL